MPSRPLGPYGFLSLVVLSGVVLDQASKWAAFKYIPHLQTPAGAVKLTSFLSLSLSRNEGGVFGIFQGGGVFFVALSVLAIVAILWLYVKSENVGAATTIAMGGIFAGAVGNLIDRVCYGYVRDFIDLHIGARHWPTFNLADLFICVGAGIMILSILFPATPRPRTPQD